MAAFASTVTERIPGTGSKERVYGTYASSAGATGGDIATGLQKVEGLFLQPTDSAVEANAPVVNETFPVVNSGGLVTIVTDADEVGIWEAYGI